MIFLTNHNRSKDMSQDNNVATVYKVPWHEWLIDLFIQHNKRNQRNWRNFLFFVTWCRGNGSALCIVQSLTKKQLYLYLSISCNPRDSGWPNFPVLLDHRSVSHSLTKILYQHEGRNRPEAWCSLYHVIFVWCSHTSCFFSFFFFSTFFFKLQSPEAA